MTKLFHVDFSSINADRLRGFHYQRLFDTKPWSDLDLSVLDGFDVNTDLKNYADKKINELKQGVLHEFNVMDVLSVLYTNHPIWQDKKMAAILVDNWWQSLLLDKNKERALYASFISCLHEHHQKNHQNHAIESLTDGLLVKTYRAVNADLYHVVKCILADDDKSLAIFALNKHKLSVKNLFNKYPLPSSELFKSKVRITWLGLYLRLPENQLSDYSGMINQWLNEQSTLDFVVERARLIFDNSYFDKDLKKLEGQTHKFTDIYKWLKKWSNNIKFKEKLGRQYINILRCWIGAGNYYQLEKTVRKISQIHREHLEEKGRNISLNRYFFWTNYQQYIIDYWILVPKDNYYRYEYLFGGENLKFLTRDGLTDELHPMILLRFDEYYFIQPLVLKAPACDLVMTKDVKWLDDKLQVDTINMRDLKSIEPCLIHDFYFGWQQEMLEFLKQFGIFAKDNDIKVAEHHGKDFKIKADNNNLSNFDKENRKRSLEVWYRRANTSGIRRNQQDLKKYAKNLQKNHITTW